ISEKHDAFHGPPPVRGVRRARLTRRSFVLSEAIGSRSAHVSEQREIRQPRQSRNRRGIWKDLFRELAGKARSANMQMIDSTHIKAHRSAAGGKGGNKKGLDRHALRLDRSRRPRMPPRLLAALRRCGQSATLSTIFPGL